MSKKNHVIHHIVFWGILAVAFTAEGWMNLLCRAIY